jgi:adenylate kinase
MRVIVTGVPGVGKTSVMERVAKAFEVPIVNYGTVMLEEAKARGVAKSRDEMRKLPADVQRQIQAVAGEKIGAMANAIVDTHCLIKTKEGYLPGIPMTVLAMIAPHAVVLVEAPAAQIHGRRQKDGSRARDADSQADIEEHQQLNRSTAAAMGVVSGATVKIVPNLDGGLEDAVRTFSELFSSKERTARG